jgi:hypothetical protein
MKSTSVFKPLCVLITSVVLTICAPQAFARGGGHGGGGGFHGGGGFGGFHGGGGGFHGGGGFGGFHGGGWGGGGWGGWRGGYGWGGGRGWGWGPGWGWGGFGIGFGTGFGWGWGSYWGGYPYAYGYPYPYYSYPYDPYYPYYRYGYGPNASAPQAPSAYDPYNNVDYSGSAGYVTNQTATPRPAAQRTVVASYQTAHSPMQQFAGLRPPARNVMQALLAMPPDARRRQVESGRYGSFSPEEQELFRKAAQLPPARTPGDSGRAKGQLQLATERTR